MADIDTILANVAGHDKSATPGPWRNGVLWHDGAYPVGPYTRNEPQANADAALIAYYRTAAPLLAAEVERLWAEVAAATDHVRALVAAMAEWGTWEDGVPAAGMDSGCGTVGDRYDAARAYLAANGAER
jgi:hypothetical protein